LSTDGPTRRREIEDSTAARLAEIVAAAEQAAKQVIDEAEAEARTRLDDAHEEADRIVAERLAGLAELTDEIGAQAAALRRGAEELQAALARTKAGLEGIESFGGSATLHREPTTEPGAAGARKPSGPALTVVGGVAEDESAPAEVRAAPQVGSAAEFAVDPGSATEPGSTVGRVDAALDPDHDFDADEPTGIDGTPAGARLLATQMAVSGSSRAEIEARLRSGFALADTRAVLDAILGPEQ
jgi:vacuolar-type H+-ATPase subunit H